MHYVANIALTATCLAIFCASLFRDKKAPALYFLLLVMHVALAVDSFNMFKLVCDQSSLTCSKYVFRDLTLSLVNLVMIIVNALYAIIVGIVGALE